MTKKAARKLTAKTVQIFNALNPAMKKVLGEKPTKADGIAAVAVLTRMRHYAMDHFALDYFACQMADDLTKALEETE